MSVVQIAFEIPSEIQTGLMDGSLIRYGGIVRDTAGHIVTHLKEVPVNKSEGTLKKAGEFIKNNKNPIIIISIAATVALVAGITYVVVKKKNENVIEVPKYIVDFDKAFSDYIYAIKNGNVDEHVIDSLLNTVIELKKNEESGNITITIPFENAELLIDMVKNYTIQFAAANDYEVDDNVETNMDEIFTLQHYLNVQKQIICKCA